MLGIKGVSRCFTRATVQLQTEQILEERLCDGDGDDQCQRLLLRIPFTARSRHLRRRRRLRCRLLRCRLLRLRRRVWRRRRGLRDHRRRPLLGISLHSSEAFAADRFRFRFRFRFGFGFGFGLSGTCGSAHFEVGDGVAAEAMLCSVDTEQFGDCEHRMGVAAVQDRRQLRTTVLLEKLFAAGQHDFVEWREQLEAPVACLVPADTPDPLVLFRGEHHWTTVHWTPLLQAERALHPERTGHKNELCQPPHLEPLSKPTAQHGTRYYYSLCYGFYFSVSLFLIDISCYSMKLKSNS